MQAGINEFLQTNQGALREWKENAKDEISELDEYSRQAARNIQSHFADFLFDPFEDGIKGMLKGFLDTIRRIAAEAAAAQIFGPKSGGGLGLGDLVSGFVSGLFGGKRAEGGPVSAGKAYLVGERGPELFAPGSSGSIVPSGKMGGITIVNHVDARGASMELAKALPALLEQTSRQTVDRVRDLVKRGKL